MNDPVQLFPDTWIKRKISDGGFTVIRKIKEEFVIHYAEWYRGEWVYHQGDYLPTIEAALKRFDDRH